MIPKPDHNDEAFMAKTSMDLIGPLKYSEPPQGQRCEAGVQCRHRILPEHRNAVKMIHLSLEGAVMRWTCIACSRALVLRALVKNHRYERILITALERMADSDRELEPVLINNTEEEE